MYPKKQSNFKHFSAKRIALILLFLLCFSLVMPVFRNNQLLAITYFPQTQNTPEHINYIQAGPVEGGNVRQKSHAPEPSTLLLLIGGLGGIVVRFARKSFERFKRGSDLALSALGALLTVPIVAFAAALIKLTSKGPAIYRQDRVGKEGRIFRIYKLRTMCVDAEAQSGAVWAKDNDPRITPVGRFLRKSHIDEIPQLINVIKGEMSIVGPRPERPELVRDLKELILDYEKRLQIKPGITGLAQVWHKYDETIQDVKKKIKYDLLYIRKMCILVDLRIMANTFVVMLTGRGAR